MPTFASKSNGLLVGLGLIVSPCGLGSVHAQETALLAGVVAAEETLVPVPSAHVSLLGTELEALSGKNGTFTFPTAPLGPATVRVDAPGFPTMVQQVEITSDTVVFLQFLLPSVSAFLDDILVTGRPTPRRLSDTRTAADLLAGQVPAMTRNSGIVGLELAEVRLRGVNSIAEQEEPIIFLNGARLAGSFGDALRLLRQIPATDVRDIRLERGPATAFLQGSVDGAIYIRTKSGRSND
jgi:hypothetical protein